MAPKRREKVSWMATFAQRLRQCREQLGLSLSDLSRHTGLSYNTLQQYEEQLTIPRIDAVEKLAKALQVSSDYLLGLSDIPTPRKGDADPSIAREWGPEVIQVLQRGRGLSPEDKEMVKEVLKRIVDGASQGNQRKGR